MSSYEKCGIHIKLTWQNLEFTTTNMAELGRIEISEMSIASKPVVLKVLGKFVLHKLEQNIQWIGKKLKKYEKKSTLPIPHISTRTQDHWVISLHDLPFLSTEALPRALGGYHVRSSFMTFIPLVLSALPGLIRRSISLVHCEITSAIVMSTAEIRNVSKYSHRRVLAPYTQDVQMWPQSSRVPGLLSSNFGICSIANKK